MKVKYEELEMVSSNLSDITYEICDNISKS